MILQTASDVARELLRNVGREYDLKRAGAVYRIYATPQHTITLWHSAMPRPIHGLIQLSEFDLGGPGPYELVPVPQEAPR
jgi:hypothetical protein